jgi:hypothetical protein
MAVHATSSHVVVWRDPRREPNDMMGWLRFHLNNGSEERPYKVEAGQISKLATWATRDAITSGVNVTVGWGSTTPIGAQDLETVARALRPVMVVCPERESLDEKRWTISFNFGPPEVFAAGAIQKELSAHVASLYPEWRHGMAFRPHALLVRHDISAEQLGLIAPKPPSPDSICNSVANDPQVREAYARFDRATPETHRDLVHARLAAQERYGIAPEHRAPLYSGEVESYLLPLLMRMGRGDEGDYLAYIRRDLRRLYGEHGETVLLFMLRTCGLDAAPRLLEVAMATAEAA